MYLDVDTIDFQRQSVQFDTTKSFLVRDKRFHCMEVDLTNWEDEVKLDSATLRIRVQVYVLFLILRESSCLIHADPPQFPQLVCTVVLAMGTVNQRFDEGSTS